MQKCLFYLLATGGISVRTGIGLRFHNVRHDILQNKLCKTTKWTSMKSSFNAF